VDASSGAARFHEASILTAAQAGCRDATLPHVESERAPRVTLGGDRSGDYVIAEEREDGSLVLAPDTSMAPIRRRHGLEPATLAEFEAEYGPVLPPDGEG
jgi:hypothetical protein